jgi:hypothetical protein
MLLIVLIVVLMLALGGGGGYYGYRRWGTGGGIGIFGRCWSFWCSSMSSAECVCHKEVRRGLGARTPKAPTN